MIGFNPCFIPECEIPLPALSDQLQALAFDNGKPISHTRFSVIFNQARGLALATGHNIDGTDIIPTGVIKRRNNFRFDPDLPASLQIDNDRGYRNNPWDRGHLVRRRALHWGNVTEARQADSESFFWTNIAPQHNRLHSSAWGKIENWILDLADDGAKRASIFTGPVYTADDPLHQNQPNEESIQIPAGFWKVAAVKHEGELRAAAFLVLQMDFDRQMPVAFDPVLEQVRLSLVELVTGLSFEGLQNADPLRFGEVPSPRGITDLRTLIQQEATVPIAQKADIQMQ